MIEIETLFAKTADGAHVAYQIVGDGATDLLLCPNWTPIDSIWEEPDYAAALETLGALCRVILFEPRGVGVSDALPYGRILTAEESASDIAAVMDAAGSGRAVLLSTDSLAPIILLATTWPDRVSSLIMVNGYARLAAATDFPIGIPESWQTRYVNALESWQMDAAVDLTCGPRRDDPAFRRWFLKALRRAAGMAGSRALFEQHLQTDVRHLLGLIQVPTLVLHTKDNPYVRIDHGRYLAEHIDGARLVELDGDGHHLAALDLDVVVDEVSEFLTGVRPQPRIDRVFATVLFSDIVNSTAMAARLGDHRWRALLDQHDALVARQLQRFSGRLVKTTGDGVVATFDGPARAVSCASAIRDGLRRLDIEVRIGIHAGEIEQREEDVSGIAVHLASRVQATATAGDIIVSRTVVDLVAGSRIAFEDLGDHELKGVPGQWRLFAVGKI